jgi:hypothetical protein
LPVVTDAPHAGPPVREAQVCNYVRVIVVWSSRLSRGGAEVDLLSSGGCVERERS